MNADLRMASQLIQGLLETMEDGAIEPEEALFLCAMAKDILTKLETTQKDNRFVRIGVWAALSIVEKLHTDITESLQVEQDNALG